MAFGRSVSTTRRGISRNSKANAYSLNKITSKKNDDGSVTIQFGEARDAPNVLPIMPGWNHTARLYRPRHEILNCTWKFPEAQPVDNEKAK